MEKTSKKQNPKLEFIMAVLVMAALFLAELYTMMNDSENVMLITGIAIWILIVLYVALAAAFDMKEEKERLRREQNDELARSQKASYMLLKKNFDELSRQIAEAADSKSGDDLAEIIKAQKAIAKITMAKTSETQDRLFIELNNLEASLNYNIRGLSEKLSGFQEEIERLADHIADINTEAILAAVKNSQEIKTVPVQETVMADNLPESTSAAVAEESKADVEAEQNQDSEEFTDFAEDMISEETDSADTDASVDDILNQLLEEEKASEPEPDPVPAPAPVMDNPNKMMSPEEIAALIAGM